MAGLISRVYVGSFAAGHRPVFPAPVLQPVMDSGVALEAWFEQWLADPAHTEALVAQRERFVTLRRREEPGWQAPADYEPPAADSYLATLPPAPAYHRRRGRSRVSGGESRGLDVSALGASGAKGEAAKKAANTTQTNEEDMQKISEENRQIGRRLLAARTKAGWAAYGGAAEICRRCKCGNSALANLEAGHAASGLLADVAKLLNIRLEWLHTGEGEMFEGQPPAMPLRTKRKGVEGRESKVEGLDASARSAVDGDDLAAAAADLKHAKQVLAEAQKAHEAARKRVLQLVEAEG